MKYILILAVIFMVKPALAQQSDWTDADRKRFKKVCEERIVDTTIIGGLLSSKQSTFKKEIFLFYKQAVTYISPCVERNIEKKYPFRDTIFNGDDQKIEKFLKGENYMIISCFENFEQDSTLKLGWTDGIKNSLIIFFTKCLIVASKDQITDENCKKIASCFVEKFKGSCDNPFYLFTMMKNSRKKFTEMILSCTNNIPSQKK